MGKDLGVGTQDSGPVEDGSWVYVIDCLVRIKLDVNLIRKPREKGTKRNILWWGLPYKHLGRR